MWMTLILKRNFLARGNDLHLYAVAQADLDNPQVSAYTVVPLGITLEVPGSNPSRVKFLGSLL
jgi:hypothetical protein